MGSVLLGACSDKATPKAPVAANSPAPLPTPMPPATQPAPATPDVTTANAPMVDEKDPAAVALGYVADATKVDKTKHAKYAAGQACSGCALYQGQVDAAGGPCPLFAGKQVSAKGWCISFVKKAA